MTREGKTQQELQESDDRCVKVGNAILKAIGRVNTLEKDLTLQEVIIAMGTVTLKIYELGEVEE